MRRVPIKETKINRNKKGKRRICNEEHKHTDDNSGNSGNKKTGNQKRKEEKDELNG